MKTYLTTLTALLAGILVLLGAGGCYTQLGTTHDEPSGRYDSDTYADEAEPADGYEEDGESDESDEYDDDGYGYGSGYGEDWHSNTRIGFNYYYPYSPWPSSIFAAAYSDPWFHWYTYDPWYAYPGSYYSPYYGGYSPYWYHHSYYGGYYGGYHYPGYYYPGYYSNTIVRPRNNREFGSTRGSGNSRRVNASSGDDRTFRGAGTGDVNLPSASGRTVTGGTDVRGTQAAPTGDRSRVNGTSRTSRNTGNAGVRSGSSRSGKEVSPSKRTKSSDRDKRRIYRDRRSVKGSSSKATKSSPAVGSPKSKPKSSGSTRAKQGSGQTRSRGESQPAVRPAPRPRPSSNTPRPSSGSSSSSSGKSRSGGQRPRP